MRVLILSLCVLAFIAAMCGEPLDEGEAVPTPMIQEETSTMPVYVEAQITEKPMVFEWPTVVIPHNDRYITDGC